MQCQVVASNTCAEMFWSNAVQGLLLLLPRSGDYQGTNIMSFRATMSSNACLIYPLEFEKYYYIILKTSKIAIRNVVLLN